MNKNYQFYAQTLEPIHDRTNAIYIGSGVEIALHLTSRPMILALRKKYRQNKHSVAAVAPLRIVAVFGSLVAAMLAKLRVAIERHKT